MALNLTQLKADMVALSQDVYDKAEAGTPYAFGYYEEQLAILIDAYITSALVTVTGVTPGAGSANGSLS